MIVKFTQRCQKNHHPLDSSQIVIIIVDIGSNRSEVSWNKHSSYAHHFESSHAHHFESSHAHHFH